MSERNEYDDLFDRDAGAAAVASVSAAPATGRNEYDDLFEREAADQEGALRYSYKLASIAIPEHEAEVLRLSRRTGMAPDLVSRNLAEARHWAGYWDIGPEQLWKDFPSTAAWLGNPENMAVAKDDVASLKGLEWWLGTWMPGPATPFGPGVPVQLREGAVQRAYRQGQAQIQLAQIANAAMVHGVDPDAYPGTAELRKLAGAGLGEADHFLGSTITGTTQILPGMLAGYVRGATFGAGAGIAGAATGVGAAASPELVSAGFVAGQALNTYDLEKGLAYDEIVREMKTRGGPVDYAAAARASELAGFVNAGLEVIPGVTALRYLPGIKQLFGAGLGSGAAKALLRPTMLRAAAAGAKAAVVQTAAESVTEGAQRAVTATAREAAIGTAGGPTDYSTIPGEAADEFMGALQSFALLSLPGVVGEFGGVASQVRRAKNNVAHLEAMTGSARASKLRERMPEKFREFVEKTVKERGDVADVYVPVEAWNTYWQGQNVDPGQVAERVLSDPKRYTEAVLTGGDVVIPVADYLDKIAPTEHHEGLKSDVRLYQGDMTLREAEGAAKAANEVLAADRKSVTTKAREDIASLPEGERTIYQAEYEKARAAGVPESQADAHARIAQGFWRTRAERWNAAATAEGGATLTAQNLYDRYQLTIQRQRAERAQKRRLFAEDLRAPEDVPRWIRDQGGIAATETSMIRPGSEDYRRVPLALRRGRAKGGKTIEELAEQLVEARFFEDDKAAVDWIVEAIHNPTGIEIPTAMSEDVSDQEAQIAADEHYRKQRQARGADVLSTADQIEALGIATGRQAVRKAVTVHRATPEEIAAHELTPGEVLYLPEARGVFTVALDEDGRVVLQDGVDMTLGDEQTVRAVRVGEKGSTLGQDDIEIQANLGREAMQRVIHEHVDEPVAMKRPGLGVVAFLWGTPGRLNQAGRLVGGEGVSHIVEQRKIEGQDGEAVALHMPDVIARGLVTRIQNEGQPGERVHISDGRHTATLALDRFGERQVWLLTGWEESEGGAGGVNPGRAYAPADLGISGPAGASPRIVALNAHIVKGKDVKLDQPAFHGSPHRFDRFDLSKVGTGEGNQSYGWGLYFTSKREVAEYYRKNLSFVRETRRLDVGEAQAKFAAVDVAVGFDRDRGRAPTKAELLSRLSHELSIHLGFSTRNEIAVRSIQEAIRLLRNGVLDVGDGQVYQVDVPEDADLLDWRKPVSEQSTAVQEVLRKLGFDGRRYDVRVSGPNTNDVNVFASREAAEAFAVQERKDPEKIVEVIERDDLESPTGEDVYNDLRERYSSPRGHAPSNAVWAESDRKASETLREAGIPGHIYEGASSGEKNYVIYDDSRVSVASKFYQRLGAGRGRGFIQFGPGGRRFNVTLLKKADPSTLAHETAHFYLEVLGDMASGADAPATIREDYAAILKWLGVASRAQVGTEQHEQFARGWERYLMEGKTPSIEMAGVFARFKAWLTKVYKEVSALRVELSPEIRGVFDRLLASEQEIQEAEQTQAYRPFDALKERMTSAEWAAYQETATRARSEAEDELRARLMSDTKRELESWFQTEREETRTAVQGELASVPVYRALRFLQRGDMLDGSEVDSALKDAAGKPWKLSRKALIAQYGKEFLSTLPRPYVYAKDGGVHSDVLAPFFGFRSGDEMVLAMQSAQKYDQAVEAETQRRLEAKYGDLLKETSRLAEEAMDAAHSEKRAEQVMIELRVLARSLSGDGATIRRIPVTLEALRRDARLMIADKKAGEIQPGVYQRAEATFGRRAFASAEKGALETAYDEKARQLWNFLLYREAVEAKKQVASDVAFNRRIGEPASLARLGKAGGDYQAQVIELLDRYDFRRRTGTDIQRRQSLRQFVDEETNAYRDAVIPEKLLDETRRLHYRELGVGELHEVREALENIEHLARLKNKFRKAAKERDRNAFKADAIATLKANVKSSGPVRLSADDLTAGERAQNIARGFDATLVRMEELAAQMDGDDPNGPFAQILIHPFADAQRDEYDWTLKVTNAIMKAISALPREARLRLTEKRHIPSVNRSLTFNQILGVALNMGNDSNFDRLLAGYRRVEGFENWSLDSIEEAVNHLTEGDWDFVQSIEDTLESLWPEMEAMEKRLHGLAPPKVERRSFTRTFADGTSKTYQGGYFPAVYDRLLSSQGERQARYAAGVGVPPLYEFGHTRAMTGHGHLQKRVDNFARAILLDAVHVIPSHLGQAIHDMTHREAILDAWEFLTDEEVKIAIVNHLGIARYDMLTERIRRIANSRVIDSALISQTWMRALEESRSAVVASTMGFKASVILQNIVNIGPAVADVGARWFRDGLVEFARDWRGATATATTLSGEMRHVMRTSNQLLSHELNKLIGKSGLYADAKRTLFYAAAATDAAVKFPMWIGAYRRALAEKSKGGEGLGQEDAVRWADARVRQALGASGTKDLALIQDAKLLQYVTMFMGWFNVAYNTERRLIRQTKRAYDEGELLHEAPRLAGKWIGHVVFVALVGEWIISRGPGNDDDDENVAEWALRKMLLYHAGMIPLLREVATAVGDASTGSRPSDIRFSPIVTFWQKIADAAVKSEKVLTGDEEPADAGLALLEVSAMAAKLPVSQLKITGGYITDVATGEEPFPDDPLEAIDRLLYRKGKAEK